MSKLFLKISLGVLIAVIVSFYFAGYIFQSDMKNKYEQGIMDHFRGPIEVSKNIIINTNPDSIFIALESLKKYYDFPMNLMELNDNRLPNNIRDMNYNKDTVITIHVEGKPVIYIPIYEKNICLLAEPFKSPPKPGFTFLILLLFAVIIIVSVVGWILSYPLVRDLRVLESASEKIAEGNHEARAIIKSTGAVGNLAKTFNIMAENIQSLIKGQRQLLRAVSHELRTPIARLRFGIENLISDKFQETKAERLISINSDFDELNLLIEQLLEYNKYNTMRPELNKQNIIVYNELEYIISKMDIESINKELNVLIDISHDSTVHADKHLFNTAIRNLLANAVAYAKKQIIVYINEDGNYICIEVGDDGSGIPLEERERLFEPFARLDDSRDRKSGGAGLGLTIVKTIMDIHNGNIQINDSELGGALFKSYWPKNVS